MFESNKQDEVPVLSKIYYNYEINKERVAYFMASVLTQPEVISLEVQEMTCEEGHKLYVIPLFAINKNICPIHNKEFVKTSETKAFAKDFISFKIKSGKDEVMCFAEPDNEFVNKLDIFDKVKIKGIKLDVKTRTKGVLMHGVLIEEIEPYEPENQVSLLSKEELIERFMSNRPKLKYPDEVWNAYKHMLLLPLVQRGIYILVLGDPGTMKTEFGIALKNISGGAYIESSKSSTAGLIGCAIKNLNGSYAFQGGAIFDAKNNLLVLDEIEKFDSYTYLYPLNEVLANHHLTYRKGDIKYENSDFWISMISFGNPIGTYFDNKTPPIRQIEETFKNNKEFLSRQHIILAIKNTGYDMSALMETSPQKDLEMEKEIAIYINQAKRIKINENNIDSEARKEIEKFVSERYNLTHDLRFARKFKELLVAEAKLSRENKITLNHVLEVEKLIKIQDKLIYKGSVDDV